MIKGMGDAECGHVQAGRFAIPRVLQHVFRSQCGRGLVTEGKRILHELDDVGFGFQVLRTVPVLQAFRQLIAGKRRPYEIVGSGDMLDLHGECAHTFVVGAWNSSSPD